MKIKSLGLIIILVAVTIFFVWTSRTGQDLAFQRLKDNRSKIKEFVDRHYVPSLLAFIAMYIMTAFLLPGALILSVAAGFLFGVILGMIYINLATVIGGTLAFLSARYLIGGWVRHRFRDQLRLFNERIRDHSHNYMLSLRLIPLLPFFLINYLAGITGIPLKTFVWTTSVGALPGSFICTFAGQQLAHIKSPDDIFSWKAWIAFISLALFFLLPVLYDHLSTFLKPADR
ncbi:MAG: TVP38/TMEM64 family protein [bacterium]